MQVQKIKTTKIKTTKTRPQGEVSGVIAKVGAASDLSKVLKILLFI